MDFIRNIFMKVFKLDEKYLPRDNNPSLIVAEGIAHLSYGNYSAIVHAAVIRA
jgi:hypothetical protein